MSEEKVILAQAIRGSCSWEKTLTDAIMKLASMTGYSISALHESEPVIGGKLLTSTIYAEKI